MVGVPLLGAFGLLLNASAAIPAMRASNTPATIASTDTRRRGGSSAMGSGLVTTAPGIGAGMRTGADASPRRMRATADGAGRAAASLAVIAASSAGHGSGRPAGMCGGLDSRAITASIGGPSNARTPVNASSNTRPREYTSADVSTSLPRACSGARYDAVPSVKSAAVKRSVPSSRTMPKSDSRARSRSSSVTASSPSRMFAGLTSRCTIACAWT
jgi:hypothetical protein